jgi:hypothetical protein
MGTSGFQTRMLRHHLHEGLLKDIIAPERHKKMFRLKIRLGLTGSGI